MKKRWLEESAALLRERIGGDADVAIMLGSGLAGAVLGVAHAKNTPYKKLRGMPTRMAAGHSGVALTGTWAGKRILAFIGRAHLYQGYDPAEVVYPVRLAHASGARTFIVTNAAGGLNQAFGVGDIMLIADQLNLTGTGVPIGNGERDPFVDMTDAYAPHLRELARKAAPSQNITLQEGVYVGLRGPAYETAAEVRFYRNAGGDAIGMSSVLETIAARAFKMQVLGLSIITNVWRDHASTSHAEVLQATKKASDQVGRLLENVVRAL